MIDLINTIKKNTLKKKEKTMGKFRYQRKSIGISQKNKKNLHLVNFIKETRNKKLLSFMTTIIILKILASHGNMHY